MERIHSGVDITTFNRRLHSKQLMYTHCCAAMAQIPPCIKLRIIGQQFLSYPGPHKIPAGCAAPPPGIRRIVFLRLGNHFNIGTQRAHSLTYPTGIYRLNE